MLRRVVFPPRVTVITTRGIAGTGIAPNAAGFPLRDSTTRDPKKPGGTEMQHREDMTHEFNRNPFGDKVVTYAPKYEEPPIDPTDPYATPTEVPYFAKGKFAAPPPKVNPNEPKGSADNIRSPEFQTIFGNFEVVPSSVGGVGALRYHKYKREPPKDTIRDRDMSPMSPVHDGHHPFYDYSSVAGHREGYNTKLSQSALHWDNKVAAHSLYRAALKGIPLVKQYYYILMPLDGMKKRIRDKFEQNKYVKDPDAIRHLLHVGWCDYTETICFRKTKGGTLKFFQDAEDSYGLAKIYTEEEGKLVEERAYWNGEEQRKSGPYDGHWSWIGQKSAEEFEKLQGRTPMSWAASKGYFEVFKPDGTNYWEKNMDYEGWYIKNVDPDRRAARKEIQSWVEAGYNQPKHYASKNRRAYRRMVKDIENMMQATSHELYAQSREQMFQYWIRDMCPESNRIHAEKRLAKQDDQVFTTKFDEAEKYLKQVVREMPNPRLWKTDAFYLRLRYLLNDLEYNWARAPIGVELERAYNDWVSADANYAIITSPEFAAIKADKKRNPMARTWADFYRDFDPDVPQTRQLPWYHPDFNYDRRYFWDERCMRMKKWVDCGDIDFRNDFFNAMVVEFEQMINRPEILRRPEAVEMRYTAPRMVQLYRALGKRMDVAMANQIKATLLASQLIPAEGAKVEVVQAALTKADLTNFQFNVPVVIYPDGMEQPQLEFDGHVKIMQVA